MAKIISQKAARALRYHEKFVGNNTQVELNTNGTEARLYLFGNLIAVSNKDWIYWTFAGWATRTTKDRIQALVSSNVRFTIKGGALGYLKDNGEYVKLDANAWYFERIGGIQKAENFKPSSYLI